MKWQRKEHHSPSQVADPADWVSWTKKLGPARIELTEFFGDISSRMYWNGKQKLFTSTLVRRKINNITTAIFNWLEEAYQSECNEDCNPISDRYRELFDFECPLNKKYWSE